MHDTARLSGDAFFRVYGDMLERPKILDVGSLDVNGTLRPLAPKNSEYVGIDLQDGLGVDIVLENSFTFPFISQSFDLVVSTSCLEHDKAFWATFSEMVRVARAGGFIYISVPNSGPYHDHPVDCWRFNKDAASALAEWYNGFSIRSARPGGVRLIEMIETFMVLPRKDVWIDNVMVFGVPPITIHESMRSYLENHGVETK